MLFLLTSGLGFYEYFLLAEDMGAEPLPILNCGMSCQFNAADVVYMASYAPLLAHTEAWQWRPDLIWLDNLRTIGSPHYYVQKIFSNYSGTNIVAALSGGKALTGQNGIYASSSVDRKNGKLYIKLINSSEKQVPVRMALGRLPYTKTAVQQTLKSDAREDFNSVAGQELIKPATTPVSITGRRIDTVSEPLSVNVLIINFIVR